MLAPGTTFGSYQVTGTLGAGGMGEVYRARDTRLKREVALKVLPEGVSGDPDRVARFQREAELLAALNHPNIAAVYGLEIVDGTAGLVLELVEGETLADRIARSGGPQGPPLRPDAERAIDAGRGGPSGPPIPIGEALGIARQMAEALEAAHEHGIVHRDLKPANVKVRPDGVVKVLDFGLAKMLEPAGAGLQAGPYNLTQSPTLSVQATYAGVILGTAPYMAPEQARGRPVDRRTDIFAFGCVLYEMLTGRPAFEGEDVAAVLARVIEREPDWSALSPPVPPRVRELLRLCLDKNPKRRRQAAGDVRIDLELALTEPPAVSVGTTVVAGPSRRMWVPIAATALAVAILATAATWYVMRPAPPQVTRTVLATEGASALTVTGFEPDVAITPDGKQIVYIGNNRTQVFVRPLDRLEPTAIGTGASVQGVHVSPDGRWVGFTDVPAGTARSLRKVPITGGPPVTIVTLAENIRGAAWTPDDAIIFAGDRTESGLQRVSAAGGDVTELTRPDKGRDHLWPALLPGGRAVLFTITETAGNRRDNSRIAVLNLDTGTYKVVVEGGHFARYLPTGHIVYVAGGTLRAVRFDLDYLEATGTPVPASEQVLTTTTGAADFAVSPNGTLVYVAGDGVVAAQRTLVWLDQQGREEAVSVPPRAYASPRISPDGRRVAVMIGEADIDLWVYEFERGTFERLTFDPGLDTDAVWSPDGTRLAYYAAGREGGPGVHVRDADGTGDVIRVTTGAHFPRSQSPDGTRLALAMAGAGPEDIGVVAVDGATPPQAVIATQAREDSPRISPDGRWLAFETGETGQTEIFVRPFPDTNAGRWRVSTAGGFDPLWAPDGRRLYYRSGNAITIVAVTDGPPSTWGSRRCCFRWKGIISFPMARAIWTSRRTDGGFS